MFVVHQNKTRFDGSVWHIPVISTLFWTCFASFSLKLSSSSGVTLALVCCAAPFSVAHLLLTTCINFGGSSRLLYLGEIHDYSKGAVA
jgi:hypothetical protein